MFKYPLGIIFFILSSLLLTWYSLGDDRVLTIMTYFISAMVNLGCSAPLKTSTFLCIVLLWNLFRPILSTLFLILPNIYFEQFFFLCYVTYMLFSCGFTFRTALVDGARHIDFHVCSHHIKIINDLTLRDYENYWNVSLLFLIELIVYVIFQIPKLKILVIKSVTLTPSPSSITFKP